MSKNALVTIYVHHFQMNHLSLQLDNTVLFYFFRSAELGEFLQVTINKLTFDLSTIADDTEKEAFLQPFKKIMKNLIQRYGFC